MKLAILISLTVCAYLLASGCRRFLSKGSLRTWLVPLLYVLTWMMALVALSVAPGYGRLCASVLAIASSAIGTAYLFGWLVPGKLLNGWALHICRGALVAVTAGPLLAMRFDQVYSLPSRLQLLPVTTLGETGLFVVQGLPGFLTAGIAAGVLSLVLWRQRHHQSWGKAGIPSAIGLGCWVLLFANWYVAGCFDIYKATQNGNTAVLDYVRYSRPGVLLAREYDGMTVMHYVRDPHTIDYLMSAGMDIDARILHGGDSGRTILHLAANAGQVDVVRCLLQHGAEVDSRDPAYWTPLGRALHENQIPTAVVLIKSGAKVDVKDRAGNTPMHWAAVQGNLKAIALLADAGAAVNQLNRHGCTPLDVVREKSAETRALLKKCGGVTSAELARAKEKAAVPATQ